MSQSKTMPLARAQQLAAAVCAELEPGCTKIEIAGSVRRRKPECGDIEIVCVPQRKPNLFGEEGQSLLDPILDRLYNEHRILFDKNGDKYKRIVLVKAAVFVDLFIVRAETWACQFIIRTGPADFSRRFVTQRSQGGMLPTGWRVQDGLLWDEHGEVVGVSSEQAAFEAIGEPWREPHERTRGGGGRGN